MVRFDAYSATTVAVRHDELIGLVGGYALQGDQERMGWGYHGFEHRWALRGADGEENAAVLWGGRHGLRVLLEVKGERSPEVVEAFRSAVPEHRCTRVDACADVDEPGAWDRLLGDVLEVKAKFKLKGERRGDWDYPEDGRTQYLGAPTSVVRFRLYEKGRQPEYRHLGRDDWVRSEVQVRPSGEARASYSKVPAVGVWGASAFTRELAARVLQAHLNPLPAGSVWRPSMRDRALAWMCRQYGQHLVSLKDDLGSWECVGLTLSETIQEQQRRLKG